jgi:predicted acyltransferase
MKKRALALDALRGTAIIGMILSGQMDLTHLPAWMAHAQVPPNSSFDPSIYGITWVDLVFPFFLFAMGAAFPFSLGSKLARGDNKFRLCWDSLVRALQLVFFAIFFQHMKPFVISDTMDTMSCLISLLAFALMFLMFANDIFPFLKNNKIETWGVKLSAFLIGFIAMYSLKYTGKKTPDFDIYFSDIIIIVLANMAFFASVIYIFTYKKPHYRLLALPFVMAIFLAGANPGWVKMVYNFSPVPWAYSFYYLKYLFIVIPGSLAGEYLYEWINSDVETVSENKTTNAYSIAFISLALIISNVVFLFTRQLELNLLVTIVLLVISYFIIKSNSSSFGAFWKKLFSIGAYCLILGLVLEAYEGGIRKDGSTYSYYFVTSGLAFFAVIFLSVICDYFKCVKSTQFLVLSGQNPMIAYVATALIVMPVLTLVSVTDYFDIFSQGPFMGFLKGVLLTTLAILITMFFSKRKWFWRT